MNVKISPFTCTPGLAGQAFINMHYADEIIANFESESSQKYVYKIVGLRGSGKSVEYSVVCEYFRNKPNWLVYTLSAGGNPTQMLISSLASQKFIEEKIYTTEITAGASAGANVLIANGEATATISKSSTYNANYYSEEAALKDMITKATAKKYKILIGIDDIAKTDNMIKFLSILNDMIIDKDKEIYLVCTGLAKNIEDFVSVPHLSFFVRNESMEISKLNLHEIAYKYQELLFIEQEEAIKLAKFTKGYAYAYQVLGEIYYKKKDKESLEDLLPMFDRVIGPQYDLIWQTLTDAEQDFIKIIVDSDTGKLEDIKEKMTSPSSYNSLRDRLVRKHILDTSRRGYLFVNLPRFKEYVDYWK